MSSPVEIWRSHKKLNGYLGKTGRLVAWTKIFVPPTGFEHQAPYIAAIVELNNKERLPVQIVDTELEDLKPNQKVRVVIRKIGKAKSEDVIEYGVKVKPL